MEGGQDKIAPEVVRVVSERGKIALTAGNVEQVIITLIDVHRTRDRETTPDC